MVRAVLIEDRSHPAACLGPFLALHTADNAHLRKVLHKSHTPVLLVTVPTQTWRPSALLHSMYLRTLHI